MESLKYLSVRTRKSSAKILPRIVGLLVASLVFATSGFCFAASVTVAWDPSPDPVVIGYTVRYGTNTGQYSSFLVVGANTQATISGLVEGKTYFFAVTAHTLLGLESGPSEELRYTVPGGSSGSQPTLNPISDLVINEDSGQHTVTLTGISVGLGGILTPLLGVTATSSNPSLIPNPAVEYTSPLTTGLLRLTPVNNAFGTATITVTVNNLGLLNSLLSRTFNVTVNAVNDAPTLAVVNPVTVAAGTSYTVSLTGISSGAPNENQALTLTASSSNPSVLPNPSVSYSQGASSATLTLSPPTGSAGVATVTVTVMDGQSQNSTVTRTFNVTVGAGAAANTLYVEAESGGVAGAMISVADTGASGGRYIYSMTDYQGTASFQVNTPLGGNYYVWCRVLSRDSGTDSFFVSVDGSNEQVFTTAPDSWSADWQWTRVNVGGTPRIFPLTPGSHSITFRGRERLTCLDALYITSDPNFSPVAAPRLGIIPAAALGVQLSFQAQGGTRWEVQATYDFSSWTTLWISSVAAVGGERFTYTDLSGSPNGRRFYRVMAR